MNSSTATENYHSDSTDNTAERIALLRLQYHCHLLSNFNVTREASKIVLRFVICFNNNAEILKRFRWNLWHVYWNQRDQNTIFELIFFNFSPFLIIPRTINILNVCSKFESHLLSYMYKQDTEFEIIFYGNKVKSLLLCCSSLKFNQMLLFFVDMNQLNQSILFATSYFFQIDCHFFALHYL